MPLKPAVHSSTASVNARAPSLDHWVNRTLSPYLVDKLSHHPRFKGRTIVVASLEGDEIQQEINGLNQHIQVAVKDVLLGAQNVKLAWQPGQSANSRQRRLSELDCSDMNQQPIIVGIESGVSNVSGQTFIRVRALDTEENIWIPGLTLKWTGDLPPKYVALTKQKHVSPHLKGLRQHPFRANEADLVANYLAKNMSCLFRNRLFGGDLTLNTQLLNKTDNPMVNQVSSLIDRYLTKFDEVTIIKDSKKANFTLEYKISEVSGNKGLFILSVALLKEHNMVLKGMESSAYLSIPKRQPVVVAKAEPKPMPAISRQKAINTQQTAFWEPQQKPQKRRTHREFRGRDIEQVEKQAFDYAMDYGPNQPRINWYAMASHHRSPVQGYFKVLDNVMRHGNECRKYFEQVDSIGSTVGLACRDMDGEWQALD